MTYRRNSKTHFRVCMYYEMLTTIRIQTFQNPLIIAVTTVSANNTANNARWMASGVKSFWGGQRLIEWITSLLKTNNLAASIIVRRWQQVSKPRLMQALRGFHICFSIASAKVQGMSVLTSFHSSLQCGWTKCRTPFNWTHNCFVRSQQCIRKCFFCITISYYGKHFFLFRGWRKWHNFLEVIDGPPNDVSPSSHVKWLLAYSSSCLAVKQPRPEWRGSPYS